MAKLWRGYLAPCGEVTKAVSRLLSLLWRGYQICGEITWGEVTLWRGYSQVTGDSPNISLESATFQLHFGFSSSFSAIFHLNCIGKHIGLCFGSWDAELDSVLTTLNTKTETNTVIHSSQFDSVRRNGHLLAALPCQK